MVIWKEDIKDNSFQIFFFGGQSLHNAVVAPATYWHGSATGSHMTPHHESPCHLPPHPIPLGFPRAPALSALLHASNLHWSSILHMVIYMCQCYSLKSSHPFPLPESIRLFYTSVSLLLSRTQGYCYHLSKFRIYALIYCIDVSLFGLLHLSKVKAPVSLH